LNDEPEPLLTGRASTQRPEVVEPLSIPGLELSPRGNEAYTSRSKASTLAAKIVEDYQTGRLITPSKDREKENRLPGREFGVQTETPATDRRRANHSPSKVRPHTTKELSNNDLLSYPD